MKVLGLMSGTSMDGLDCCLSDLKINNNNLSYKVIKSNSFNFCSKDKSIIYNYIFNKKYTEKYIHDYLGKLFSKYCIDFLNGQSTDLIAMHGQTVSHVDKKYSIQLGNPQIINKKLNLPILYNFREFDIKNGGNGAPLVPYLDWLLFKENTFNTLSINIGGISNLSFIKNKCKKNEIIGFDTGPGMCLVDQYVKEKWNIDIDFNGELSKKGFIDSNLLSYLLANDFIKRKPPKSASTEMYDSIFLSKINKKFSLINKYNFLRTLLNFTAKSIKKNVDLFINEKLTDNDKIIISGGGVKNKTLFNDLCSEFKNTNVKKMNLNNINIDNKEAFLMCLMGYTRYMNIENNIPSVTGAKCNVVCGDIYE